MAPAARHEPPRWPRIQVGETLQLVAVQDVCYFKSTNKYTRVLTRDREYLLRTPLKELIPQLDPEAFWRIHRGTVVNVGQIRAARRDLAGRLQVSLKDRMEVLAVSRGYGHLFRQM